MCFLFAVIVLARAWVAEDAYITFRVIDNFWNGYGLRWNISERVMAYTHPLWMALESVFVGIWNNPFLVAIMLGAACSTAAFAVVLATVKRPLIEAICFLVTPLLISEAFLDYTTSGMENALSYVLFALFGYLIYAKSAHPRFWFYLSLTVSLALLTRLDMALFYAPPVIYVMRHHAPVKRQVALGLLPLVLWLAFSLFYYGFIFPNTKYAKLDTGMPLLSYLNQGIYYAKNVAIWDTPSALALVLPIWLLWKRALPTVAISIAAGIYIYCLYVIYIGGDYMAGRFWSVPVFASVWLWFAYGRYTLKFAGLLAAAFIAPFVFGIIQKDCGGCLLPPNRVIDGRIAFNQNSLLAFDPLRVRSEGEYYLANRGKQLSDSEETTGTPYFIGMVGYYAGPEAILADELGLADPLLARLPSNSRIFYIGHFRRSLPRGYMAYLKTSSMASMPKPLAEYYAPLHLITAGDLWDIERLKTIFLFNLGYYDHWRQQYLDSNPRS